MHSTSDFCRGGRRSRPACAYNFYYCRNQRDENYCHDNQREVFLHNRLVCKPEACRDEKTDQENCSRYTVKKELQIIHLPNSRNEGSECADDRHKPCKYNGLSPIFFVKLMRPHKMSPIKPARTLAFEYFWPDKVSDPVIGRIA